MSYTMRLEHPPSPLRKGEVTLQDFSNAVGVAAALAGEELGACPHLTGYLATDVAHFFILQRNTFGIGDEDGQMLHFVLNGIGILRRTGGTADDSHGLAVLDKGNAFVDFAGRKVLVGFLRIRALDADATEVLHDFVHMVGVDGVIDGDVPVVIVEMKGLFKHGG